MAPEGAYIEMRKRYSAEFKAKIAMEALQEQKTLAELAAEYEVHTTQIVNWKKELQEKAVELFARETGKKAKKAEDKEAELYRQIGQLKVELDWLKKNLPNCTASKRQLVEEKESPLSVRRQCRLLGLNRSSYYYRNKEANEETRCLLRLIDEIYTGHPFYGARRIATQIRRLYPELTVTRKRVGRLMREMGIEAIYPKPRLSRADKDHAKYPYLLKGLEITRPNQVWSTDITYIPTTKGHVYLVAIIDWHSRYVLSWKISNSMDAHFCREALEEALEHYGKPEIFNSDQGSQFTSAGFVGILQKHEIRISMDGRGRCLDNIFVERLWRSMKYEEVYLKEYDSLPVARGSLEKYFEFYNRYRPHQSLQDKTPAEVYFNLEKGVLPPLNFKTFLNSAA